MPDRYDLVNLTVLRFLIEIVYLLFVCVAEVLLAVHVTASSPCHSAPLYLR